MNYVKTTRKFMLSLVSSQSLNPVPKICFIYYNPFLSKLMSPKVCHRVHKIIFQKGNDSFYKTS